MLGFGGVETKSAVDYLPIEFKFNPYHDPTNGKCTDAGYAFHGSGGSGGSGGGGGASGNWDDQIDAESQKRGLQSIPLPDGTPPKNDKAKSKPKVRAARPPQALTSGGYRFETDSSGRTTSLSGELRLQPDQKRSSKHQKHAGKPDRLASDHGGHFIAREFGGPAIALNHFAQDARSNRSEYRKLELSWKADLRRGRQVSVNIRATYVGNSRRPAPLSVAFYVNRLRKFKRIKNARGGK